MLSGRHQVEFSQVFDKFKTDVTKDSDNPNNEIKGDVQNGDKNNAKETEEQKLSRRKAKELNRMRVSELKQIVKRPDVVESWDVTSKDPLFLVWLKCIRNSVPVPKHW